MRMEAFLTIFVINDIVNDVTGIKNQNIFFDKYSVTPRFAFLSFSAQ